MKDEINVEVHPRSLPSRQLFPVLSYFLAKPELFAEKPNMNKGPKYTMTNKNSHFYD